MSDHFETLSIEDSVHYCGFLYGLQSKFNPYQDYLYRFHRGEPKREIRDRFIRFLVSYRPRNMAEALNIRLTKEYSLWEYPWNCEAGNCSNRIIHRILYLIGKNPKKLTKTQQSPLALPGEYGNGTKPPPHGWLDDPLDIPDILTHFSSNGIYMFQIEQEFVWLERIYYWIREKGYRDDIGPDPIQAIKLVAEDSRKKYIIVDGNHRISALYALGYADPVRCRITDELYEDDLNEWPLVKSGLYEERDARSIFSRYFTGNDLGVDLGSSSIDRSIVKGIDKAS